MPVHVEKHGDKYRIVEQSGRIATTDKGNARDGGGHTSERDAYAQARYINNARIIMGSDVE